MRNMWLLRLFLFPGMGFGDAYHTVVTDETKLEQLCAGLQCDTMSYFDDMSEFLAPLRRHQEDLEAEVVALVADGARMQRLHELLDGFTEILHNYTEIYITSAHMPRIKEEWVLGRMRELFWLTWRMVETIARLVATMTEALGRRPPPRPVRACVRGV